MGPGIRRWNFKIREQFWYKLLPNLLKLLPYVLVNPTVKINLLKSIRMFVIMKSIQVCHLQYNIHMYVIWECSMSYWRVYVFHIEEYTYVILQSIRISNWRVYSAICCHTRVYVLHIEEYTYTYFILKSVHVFHIQEYTYTYFILKSVDVFHIDEFACTYFISKSLYVFHVEEYTFAIHVSYKSLRISHWRVYVLRLQFGIRMESICIRIASPIWIRILFNMKYVDSEYVYSSIWNT